MITNGTLIIDALAAELVRAGVRVFEFTLLSADRQTHNAMVRRDSFDRLIESISSVRAAGGTVTTTFVATKLNIERWPETLELSVALGASGVLFNRFNAGGAGAERIEELMPSADQLRRALVVADDAAKRYGIGISCGVPVPPCVVDRRVYSHIRFGDCPVGRRGAYPAVDAAGNVRSCNHSPTILGNLFESDFRAILRSRTAAAYAQGEPRACEGCEHIATCRGGCRAAAEVCGSRKGVDPFVEVCNPDGRWSRCDTCV